jgi:hypothetical protein
LAFLEDFISRIKLDGSDAEKTQKRLVEGFEGMRHAVELLSDVEIFRAAKEVGDWVVEKLKGPAEYADRILSMSAAAGLGVEQLQRLQFSAQQNGVSAESAATSINHLNRTLDQARGGSKEALTAFTALGISQEKLASFKDSDEALMAITDSLKAMQDPIKRGRLAMDIFGRSGAAQLKWLASGSAEMAKMKQRAQDLGAVISEKDARSLNEMGDILESVGSAIKGFVSTLMAELAPAVIYVVEHIEDWWIANKKLIQSGIEEWINDFLFALGFLYAALSDVIGVFVDWLKAHRELLTTVRQLIEEGFKKLADIIASVAGKIGHFVKNNKELVAVLTDVAEFVAVVYFLFGLWKNIPQILGGAITALTKVRQLMTGIAVATGITELEILAVVAALALVLVGMKTAYDYANGKDVDKGWIGDFKRFGAMVAGKASPGQGASNPGDDQDEDITPVGSGVANLVAMYNKSAAAQGAKGTQTPNRFRSMYASTSDDDAQYGPDETHTLPPQNVTIHAPITLHAEPGTPQEKIVQGVKDATQEAMNRAYRQAESAVRPTVRH